MSAFPYFHIVMIRRRWPLYLVCVLIVLGLTTAGALLWGARVLKKKVESALGPESSIGSVEVAWDRVEIHRLRVKAPPGWPVEDVLRAEKIVLWPDLRELFSSRLRIDEIRVEAAYLSLLRTPQGQLRLLPGLLQSAPAEPGRTLPAVEIGRVVLKEAMLDFFDASVRKPPLKVSLEQVEARIEALHLPTLAGRAPMRIEAILKGRDGDGHVGIDGWVDLSNRDMDLTTNLRRIDLRTLEPYLVKAANTGVKRGTLDMDVHATVAKRHLKAPGTITLHGLDLASEGALGLPRQAAVALMRDRRENIVLRFSLDGDLDDPKFKLNENIAARFTTGLAETLGVSVGGLAEGAASLGQKSVEAVGGTFRKLFGSDKK